MPVRMVEALRAGVVESSHYGNAVVVDGDGRIICSEGDPERISFFRSTSKPLQAIYFIESGIAEKFNLDLKEIAVITSSHTGEKEHINTLKSILKKIGEDETVLKCGVHDPISKEACNEITLSGSKVSILHNNCSGKHLGFIATAKAKGYPIKDYYKSEHNVQVEAEKIILEFGDIRQDDFKRGFDGCGVPVIAAPLKNLAKAYANLCNDDFKEGKYKKSQSYLISAMSMYPEMVGGKGRVDTEIMKHFGSRIIGKIGDEAIFCAGIIGKAMGIAIKIEDGNMRALGPALMNLLLKLNIIDADETKDMMPIFKPVLTNHKGEIIGELRSVF
ncbi:MAG: asparaginase [Bacillota bacterium]|nr:asparaginase [Bacillota bacterium]